MTTYALINKQTNVCENVVLDDRDISDISIDDAYFLLPILTTPTLLWAMQEDGSYAQITAIGNGGIGFVWDGEKLIGPNPVS